MYKNESKNGIKIKTGPCKANIAEYVNKEKSLKPE